MPRIDPLSLLKCLSVLLGPNGGIKSRDEVQRLANLITKYSKKLVSKCIYIQILKSTNTELLSQFMSSGGWNLIHMWMTDGIVAKNWALIQEILELLLLCPVDIERLKSNNCPKLVKGLSKEGSHQSVRKLAGQLVEQWLKLVKSEAGTPGYPITSVPTLMTIATNQLNSTTTTVTVASADITHLPDGNCSLIESSSNQQLLAAGISQMAVQDQNDNSTEENRQDLQQQSPNRLVRKMTIRDGGQVLSKLQYEAVNHVKSEEGLCDRVNVKAENGADVEMSLTNGPDQLIFAEVNLVSNQNFNNVKATDNKDNKDVSVSDSNKSSENNRDSSRDSHRRDDKKSSSFLDKKAGNSISSNSSSSHHHSSSSKSSSSRHGSSHKSSSNSHKSSSSSSHRSKSAGSSSSTSRDKSSSGNRERERDRKHGSTSSKSKSDKEKEKLKKEQEEKDKATLEKVASHGLGKVGKIPKKKVEDGDKKSDSKENKDKTSVKSSSGANDKKNISISIERSKNLQNSRPKTVKTFNSKFRSTGLEEEVKLPPPRTTKKAPAAAPVPEKKVVPPKVAGVKTPAPSRDTSPIPEKKIRLSLDTPSPQQDEKKGGIKLIAPKPKPMLQESDMFMDALTASTKSKEPRKRKRRTSVSKDNNSETKKTETGNSEKETTPPPSSPSGDEKSPVVVKPNFKFYQDTLDTEDDKEESKRDKSEDDIKDEDMDFRENTEDERSCTPIIDEDFDKASDSEEANESRSPRHEPTNRNSDGLKSVLVLQKRKGPKKSLKWKTDLESVRYFELDETERVNVTKTFTDMKQMEKQNEREFNARKCADDIMEEKTIWKPMIPIDLPAALVEPGNGSEEKEIQTKREKGILQAIYFSRSMIPDSPAEPEDLPNHIATDVKIIPLDDLTGNKESEKDFTTMPWPEPKPSLGAQQTTVTNYHYQQYPQASMVMTTPMVPHPAGAMVATGMMPPMGVPPPVGVQVPVVAAGGGGWRTGDGKVVVPDMNMAAMGQIAPPGTTAGFAMVEGPSGMVPTGMMPPGIYPQPEGFGMMPPDDMAFSNFTRPHGPPGMYAQNFQHPRGGGGGPMHRARGAPGWFRGGPPMRGGGWPRESWRGGKQLCRQFSKKGYCSVGEKCGFLHPGVNCPPF